MGAKTPASPRPTAHTAWCTGVRFVACTEKGRESASKLHPLTDGTRGRGGIGRGVDPAIARWIPFFAVVAATAAAAAAAAGGSGIPALGAVTAAGGVGGAAAPRRPAVVTVLRRSSASTIGRILRSSIEVVVAARRPR